MSARRAPRDADDSLRRGVDRRAVRSTFRVYVEGRVTEIAYIDALRQATHLASSTSVRVMIGESGAVPLALVEAARRDRHRT